MENIRLDFYYVWLMDYDGDIDVLYEGIDKIKAERSFERADLSDFNTNMQKYGGDVNLERFTNTYKYIYDEDVEDYPIEDYYDDSDIYELVEEGRDDIVLIKTKNIIGQNEIDEKEKDDAKDILIDVYHLLKNDKNVIYHKSAGWKSRQSDYFLYKINDDENIEIRLSNHSLNAQNVKKNDDIILEEKIIYKDDDEIALENKFRDKYKNEKEFYIGRELDDYGQNYIVAKKPKNRIALLSVIIYGVENATKGRFNSNLEELDKIAFQEIEYEPLEDNLTADDIYRDILLYIEDLIDDYKKGGKEKFKSGGTVKTYWYKGLFNTNYFTNSDILEKGGNVDSEYADYVKRVYDLAIYKYGKH